MLSIQKNDRKARRLIITVSVIIFLGIVLLDRVKLDMGPGFNEHIFATINAVINSSVALLLLGGLYTARTGRYTTHKYIMLTCICLSVLFLLSYICHHLFSGETKFGGEGSIRYVYYFILITHIILAAIILPFILFTAYRALILENAAHRKLARITWPIWFYVALSGVAVYMFISPYYT
jgi:putative membrane protein